MPKGYREEEDYKYLKKSAVLKRLLLYFKPHKKEILIVSILTVIQAFIISILPLFTSRIVDVNIKNQDLKGLIITVLEAISLCIIWVPIKMTAVRMAGKLSNSVVFEIRKETYNSVIRYQLYFFDNRPAGKILSRLIGDMDALKQVTLLLTQNLVPNLLLLLFFLIVMFSVSPILTTPILLSAPLMLIGVYFLMIRNWSNWQKLRSKEANYKAYIHEDFAGIKTIQSFNAEERTNKEAKRLWKEIWEKWIFAVGRSDFVAVIMSFSQALGYFFLFLISVKILKMGSSSVGEILSFVVYVGLFWSPIRELARMYNQLSTNFISASRVFELQDEKSFIIENQNGKDLKGDGCVEFKNVYFAYPDEKDKLVLNNVSFKVEGGKSVALVGPTGAGKTTIINLISRFFDPIIGEVLIDGIDLKDVKLKSLRENVSLMPQDSVLFTGTIRENLTYGKEVTDKEIWNAINKLNLKFLIDSFPDSLDTEVKTLTLSQGQKQLIALVRTLLSDPKVLILDEATSNVDTPTEQKIQEGLKLLMKDRTTFVVAHRLSTIRNSDEIFFVDDGCIKEKGSHEELMRKDTEYKKLYMSQFDS